MSSKQINILPAIAASTGCTASCSSYYTGTGEIGYGPAGSQYYYTNFQLVATAASGWAVDRIVYHYSWSASDGTSGTSSTTTRNIEVNPFYQPDAQVFTTYEWPGDFNKISGGDFPVHTTSQEITSIDVYFKTGPTPPPGVKVVSAYASPSDGGTVQVGSAESGATSSQGVETGGSINIVATAASGYAFKGWYLSSTLVSSSATYTVSNVTADKTFEARFVPVYTIEVVSYSSRGTVSLSGGTDESFTGFNVKRRVVESGTQVTIGAYSNNSSVWPFKAWYIVPYVGANPDNMGTLVPGAGSQYTTTVTSNIVYHATFREGAYVAVSVAGDYGAPSVTPTINGRAVSSLEVADGSTVTLNTPVDGGDFLNPFPDGHYFFDRWQELVGSGYQTISTNPTYSFTALASHGPYSIEAYYKIYYKLTTEVSPNSSAGTITVSPTSAHGDFYPLGQTLTLTATPQTGFHFVKWTRRGPGTYEREVSTSSQITLTSNSDFDDYVWIAYFDRSHLLVNSSSLSTPVQLVYDPATNLLVADY